jgi:predicted RNase H-like HicB family nuclease
MNEIIFLVEDAPEGGYTARALGESIFTEGDTPEEIEQQVREAVRCHFEAGAARRSFACISSANK